MIIEIEKELSKIKSHIIDYASIRSILVNMGYKSVGDKINMLKQKGILKSVKQGLYFHSSIVYNNILVKEILANIILGPSYISLEYALSYYGLIPEAVYEITCISTKRSKRFNTEVGSFSYKMIKKELFSIGINMVESKSGNFIIASKEKALCDIIYFSKDASLTSRKTISEFLENDLRIDMDELIEIDISIIQTYYEVSKSKKIGLFLKFVKELNK